VNGLARETNAFVEKMDAAVTVPARLTVMVGWARALPEVSCATPANFSMIGLSS